LLGSKRKENRKGEPMDGPATMPSATSEGRAISSTKKTVVPIRTWKLIKVGGGN